MMLKFSRRVIFSTSSYFTLILLLICIRAYMKIHIYLLKHIFSLIKNRDRKDAYPTFICGVTWRKKCYWNKQNYLQYIVSILWAYLKVRINPSSKVKFQSEITKNDKPRWMISGDERRGPGSSIRRRCSPSVKLAKQPLITRLYFDAYMHWGRRKESGGFYFTFDTLVSATKNILLELEWERHSVYNLDVASSDFYLFRSMQNHLSRMRFEMRLKYENESINLSHRKICHSSIEESICCLKKI